MTASLKIRALDAKISELQAQQQKLLRERNMDIAQDISRLNLAHHDHRKLMGALLFISNKITTYDPIAEDWLIAGEKFLRQGRIKSRCAAKTAVPADTANQPS